MTSNCGSLWILWLGLITLSMMDDDPMPGDALHDQFHRATRGWSLVVLLLVYLASRAFGLLG